MTTSGTRRNGFELQGSRILVTGGGGIIGRPTALALAGAGAVVTVLERPGIVPQPGSTWVAGDVLDARLVGDLVRAADAVVHLAGIPGLDHGGPNDIYRANTLGTFTVLAAAGEAGVRKAVYASSINASGLPLNPHAVFPTVFPYDEDEPPDIADWYSLSKKANEDAAAMVARRWGIQLTGLRFPLVRDITLDGGARFARHIGDVVASDPRRAACEGWSYLDSSDAARAVVAALTHDTPACPGILVAAPKTFLAIDTEVALEQFAPGAPRHSVAGRSVALDLTRSRQLLEFDAQLLLENVDIGALLTPSPAAGKLPSHA